MFTIEMSSPFRSGWRGGLGGPNSGGHQQPPLVYPVWDGFGGCDEY